MRSRNYLNFALLAPGVTASNQAASPSTLALPESGFSFGGLRPRSNAVYIDGVDNNDEFTGASRTELSLETVREFQVVNQGLAAEAGGVAGGSINVVTRTGANTYHGDAFLFIENGALDATSAGGLAVLFDRPNWPQHRPWLIVFVIVTLVGVGTLKTVNVLLLPAEAPPASVSVFPT